MTHDGYRELLFLSASGDIDADGQAVIERHLKTCGSCRKEYDGLKNFHQTIMEHRPGIEPGEDLLREARQEFRVALRKEIARRPAWRGWLDAVHVAPAARMRSASARDMPSCAARPKALMP